MQLRHALLLPLLLRLSGISRLGLCTIAACSAAVLTALCFLSPSDTAHDSRQNALPITALIAVACSQMIDSLTHWLTHTLTYSLPQSLAHSLTNLLTLAYDHDNLNGSNKTIRNLRYTMPHQKLNQNLDPDAARQSRTGHRSLPAAAAYLS